MTSTVNKPLFTCKHSKLNSKPFESSYSKLLHLLEFRFWKLKKHAISETQNHNHLFWWILLCGQCAQHARKFLGSVLVLEEMIFQSHGNCSCLDLVWCNLLLFVIFHHILLLIIFLAIKCCFTHLPTHERNKVRERWDTCNFLLERLYYEHIIYTLHCGWRIVVH